MVAWDIRLMLQVPFVEATDASLEGYGYIVHSKEQFRYGMIY